MRDDFVWERPQERHSAHIQTAAISSSASHLSWLQIQIVFSQYESTSISGWKDNPENTGQISILLKWDGKPEARLCERIK